MALHTRKDWGLMCGLSAGNLSNYIKRGKVILTGELIDDSKPENIDFLQKFSGRKQEKSNESEQKPREISEDNKNSTKKEIIQRQKPTNEAEVEGGYSLDRKLKAQELKKKEAETRLLNLKEEKIRGEHIPTELVRSIVILQSQSFVTAFKNGLEDFITIVAKAKGMNVNEVAEARGELIRVINLTANKAVEQAKKGIDNIVGEYAVKREVGEHD
jgi:hypothetical protein